MPTLDEQIAQSLRDAQRSGELQSVASWGKPLGLDDAYAQTPEAFRMAFKALKDAGFVPPEVEAMQQIAALRTQLAEAPGGANAEAMRQRLAELQQHLALRFEKLERSGSL